MPARRDPIGPFGFSCDGQTARLAQLSYPNGQTSSYSYFGNSGDRRLQEIHHQTSGAATLSTFDYAYDVVGNITTWTQQYQSTTRAYDFGYDAAANQLTSAIYRTTDATPTMLTRYGYSYDAVGNRTNQQTDDAPAGWTYDAMNRLTAQSGTSQLKFEGTVNEAATVTVGGKPATVNGSGTFVGNATVTNGTNTVAIAATDASGNSRTQEYSVDVTNTGGTFSYDANGNLTAHGTRTYSWDAENRLVQVADDGTPIASFTYDGAGRRASKTAGGTTHNFVYEGSDIQEDRITAGATTRNIHGPAIDQPLASVDSSGNPTYYLADHLGSSVQTTDASGAVTLTRQYDPYGNLLQGETTSGYAFTGREWDAELGLNYNRARYYLPTTGRFVTEDPIGFRAGSNFYVYAGSNPVSRTDPFGLDWLNNLADFSAGVGSVLTFGLTDYINDTTGAGGVVNKCSVWHLGGTVAGALLTAAIGGAAGAEAAEAQAGKTGFEFSHWIPARMGGPRSVFNGNYVSQQFHYLTDPFRYPPGWQAFGPKLPAVTQQLLRIPWIYDGAAAGAAYGGASVASRSGCGCK